MDDRWSKHQQPKHRLYVEFIKPMVDWLCALILLIVSIPVLLPAILALTVANKGRVWFFQPRPGKHGRIFRLIKFRTMTDSRDSTGNLLSDEERLTPVGKFIRKTSIDELPQLFNVLCGHMSLIGPRPLLVEYLSLYSEEQKRRHLLKPGITGWAQINGRNSLSWQQKFELDCWYVDHVSFWLDIKILFLTVKKVLIAEGINSATSATMEKFNGSN